MDSFAIAAQLAQYGVRVARIGDHYLFTGCGVNVATFDNGLGFALDSLPRAVACLIEQYLYSTEGEG